MRGGAQIALADLYPDSILAAPPRRVRRKSLATRLLEFASMFARPSSVPRRAWMPAVLATLLLSPELLAQSGRPGANAARSRPATRADSLYVSADPADHP